MCYTVTIYYCKVWWEIFHVLALLWSGNILTCKKRAGLNLLWRSCACDAIWHCDNEARELNHVIAGLWCIFKTLFNIAPPHSWTPVGGEEIHCSSNAGALNVIIILFINEPLCRTVIFDKLFTKSWKNFHGIILVKKCLAIKFSN